ncbi:MAG: hypothetical protein AAFN74_23180 [Myxococcota bacterium]
MGHDDRSLREVLKLDRLLVRGDTALRRLRGTPWIHTEHFEVLQGTWNGVLRIHDDSGRLLGENHGLPWGATTHPTIELRPANFAGSRHGKPYNVAALRQMATLWPQVRTLIARARALFIGKEARGAPTLTLWEVMTVARIVTAYPAFLLRRHSAPLSDKQVPALVASAFKVMAGIHSSIEYMFEHDGPTGLDLEQTISARALFDYIENHGLFLSGDGRACGGPERLIRDILRVTTEGCAPTPRADETFELDAPALLRYGRFTAGIELIVRLAADIQAEQWTNDGRRLQKPYDRPIEPAVRASFRQQLIGVAARATSDDSLLDLLDAIDTTPERSQPFIIAALDRLSRRTRAVLGRSTEGPGFVWSDLRDRLGIRYA